MACECKSISKLFYWQIPEGTLSVTLCDRNFLFTVTKLLHNLLKFEADIPSLLQDMALAQRAQNTFILCSLWPLNSPI